MRKKIHQPDCPTLRDQTAKWEFMHESLTMGQEGCPFCEMQEVEIPDERAMAQIETLIKLSVITLQEAAGIFGYAYSSLAEGAREGRFECRKSGGTWITTRAAIQQAIDGGKLRGPRSK